MEASPGRRWPCGLWPAVLRNTSARQRRLSTGVRCRLGYETCAQRSQPRLQAHLRPQEAVGLGDSYSAARSP